MNDVWQRLRTIALTDVGRAIAARFRADKERRAGGGAADPAVAQAVGAYLAAPLPAAVGAVAEAPAYTAIPAGSWASRPTTISVREPVPVPPAVPQAPAPRDPVPTDGPVAPGARVLRRHRAVDATSAPEGATTTVSLVFADGAEVELAPDDPRVRPFRTAVALLVDG